MSKLNVLVANELEDDDVLQQILQKCGYEVAVLNLNGLELSEVVNTLNPDIVILNLYRPENTVLRQVIAINQHRQAVPVIMFAEDQSTDTINKVIKAGVSAYIVDGFEAKRIKAIVDIAMARFKEQQALKRELEKTKNRLEERKDIDKAKALLIKTQDYSEEQAYHALRKLAMERSLTIGEMAKNVLAMADLLHQNSTQ
ncbi:ANTAR domain-containing response regulator [Methylomarinum vadi]|uniref:ANTAR domain-containing response regulator n=1 Tax=Methylomarinum vadi TaxID=438855 RepID=UPI0004DEDC4E|nr:ANTAR domain-containing protein [Methylomarinum vadi]